MKIHICIFALLTLLAAQAAQAGPSEYVFTPSVTYAEKEIDLKYGTIKKPAEDRISAGSIGYGMGVSQAWMAELYILYKRADGDKTEFDAFEGEINSNSPRRANTPSIRDSSLKSNGRKIAATVTKSPSAPYCKPSLASCKSTPIF